MKDDNDNSLSSKFIKIKNKKEVWEIILKYLEKTKKTAYEKEY